MDLFKKEKNKQDNKSIKTTNPFTNPGINNKVTDDRYMNLALSKRNWQIATFGLLIANIVMALVLCYIAVHSKVETRVAMVNNGMVVDTVKTEELGAVQKNQMAKWFLTQFIVNSRLVSSDEVMEKNSLNAAYSSVSGQAIEYLNEWYQANDPLNLAAKYTVSAEVINFLQKSPTSMQIIWDETKRSVPDGNVIGTTRWYAQVEYQFTEPDAKHIKDNPLGIFINKLTWSQTQ